ncbi:MFS transporter [Streptomyces sp. NBC_00996]|uniref:MFS transporter n=1 Tax=Streptomyces sp. NBC_00996 TaxID=2903710 RepID=UPI003869E331|nr:MFS transporter [Streptomyces sp. NBC_00996]
MTTTVIPPAPATTGRPAHRDGNVLRWLGAYASSMIGDNICYLALSWAAVQSGTPAQAGLVMTVSAVPRALLMLGGGVVADRFGPRKVVIGSDTVRCVAVLALAALLFATSPSLWLLALLAVVFGTVDAVFMPAVGALPARITSRDQLARVQGMRGLAIRCANVIGAPLGGLGVALGGAAAAFGLAGMLIAVSVPLLISVRMRELPGGDVDGAVGASAPSDTGHARVAADTGHARVAADRGHARVAVGTGHARVVGGEDSEDVEGAAQGQPARATAWRDLREGLRYIRRHRVLAPLIAAIALGDLGFVGPLNVGLTLLADQRGWGASGMGWVLAGFGTGAGAAALLLAVRGRLPHAGRLAAVAILTGSVAIGALAFVPNVAAAIGVALLVGLLAGLSGALCGALLQTQADPAYLGRVSAVSGIVSLGLAPLSMPLTAAAIGWWGTGPVFVTSAGVCGLGGVLALCVGPLRRAELPA